LPLVRRPGAAAWEGRKAGEGTKEERQGFENGREGGRG